MADSSDFWDAVEAAFCSGEPVVLAPQACDADGLTPLGPVRVVRFDAGERHEHDREVFATFRSEDGRLWEAAGVQRRACALSSPRSRE